MSAHDVALESGRLEDLEKELDAALSSPLDWNRSKAEDRLVEAAELEPMAVMEMILSRMSAANEKSRASMEGSLRRIVARRNGAEALLRSLSSRRVEVRRMAPAAVAMAWGEKGRAIGDLHLTYAEHRVKGQAQDIHFQDLDNLVEIARVEFLEQMQEESIEDMETAVEFARVRSDNWKHLNTFFYDSLRKLPTLEQSHAADKALSAVIRHAMKSSGKRRYPYLEATLDRRSRWISVRDGTRELAELASLYGAEGSGMVVGPVAEALRDLRIAASSNDRPRMEDAIAIVVRRTREYLDQGGLDQIIGGDPGAQRTIMGAALGCLKGLRRCSPEAADRLFTENLEGRLRGMTLERLDWPAG
jgi:hypothetical protein